MTVSATKELSGRSRLLVTDWSGYLSPRGVGKVGRMAALILPSSVAAWLPHSSSFCPISKARFIYSNDCYYWTLSGIKAYGEVSTIPPLAGDAKAVKHFSKLPEGECKCPSLVWKKIPDVQAAFSWVCRYFSFPSLVVFPYLMAGHMLIFCPRSHFLPSVLAL